MFALIVQAWLLLTIACFGLLLVVMAVQTAVRVARHAVDRATSSVRVGAPASTRSSYTGVRAAR